MTSKYDHLSREELSRLAFHEVKVSTLSEYCNPFNGGWIELDHPISKEEIRDCITNGNPKLTNTPIWTDFAFNRTEMTIQEARKNHIEKIAYFATREITDPIEINVGLPEMSCYVDHMVSDGNHRLAGAIYSGQEYIKTHVFGSASHAQELGLYNPNEFEAALCERDEQEYSAKRKRKKSP